MSACWPVLVAAYGCVATASTETAKMTEPDISQQTHLNTHEYRPRKVYIPSSESGPPTKGAAKLEAILYRPQPKAGAESCPSPSRCWREEVKRQVCKIILDHLAAPRQDAGTTQNQKLMHQTPINIDIIKKEPPSLRTKDGRRISPITEALGKAKAGECVRLSGGGFSPTSLRSSVSRFSRLTEKKFTVCVSSDKQTADIYCLSEPS